MAALLLLLLLLLTLTVRSECLTVGKEFLAVFPENIAYYHPSPPQNQLRILALHGETAVTLGSLSSWSSLRGPHSLRSGEVKEIMMDPALELDRTNVSANVVTVTSDKDIAVDILSLRGNSIQTAVLLPTEQLGQEYKVPPIPKAPQDYDLTRTTAVTERNPFKLLLVNGKDGPNTITLQGSSFELEAKQVVQLWVNESMVDSVVSGTERFLAVLAHPCTVQFECTCGVLYTPLRPHSSTALTFLVPPVFSQEAADQTYLLKQTSAQQFTGGSFEQSGPVLLQKPGLLMNLIPKEEFGSCFAVNTVAEAAENWAVIVAPSETTKDVHIGNSPAGGSWEHVPGTDGEYKYGSFRLNDTKTIIWNKFGLMAVYFLGKKLQDKEAWFGNPAPRLSKDPDHRGCVLEPAVKEVLHEEKSWQKSIQECRSRNLDLVSLSDKIIQTQIYNWTLSLNQSLTELWMGLRLSSYSAKWYWISEDPLLYVDWSQDSPGDRDQGQCARISLKDSQNPGWVPHDCCQSAKAVCYRPPKLLQI